MNKSKTGKLGSDQIRCVAEVRFAEMAPTLGEFILGYFKGLPTKQVELVNKALFDHDFSLDYCDDCIRVLFGLDRPRHPFGEATSDWGLRISEPQATAALCRLIDEADPALRAFRAERFLSAINCDLEFDNASLQDCQVFAEYPAGRQRIDLLLQWVFKKRTCLLVVEAKFNYSLTDGQLKSYEKFIEGDFKDAEKDYVVLGLNSDVQGKLSCENRKLWRFMAWHGLWLSMVRTTETEDAPHANFMYHLWRRMGAFRQGEKH